MFRKLKNENKKKKNKNKTKQNKTKQKQQQQHKDIKKTKSHTLRLFFHRENTNIYNQGRKSLDRLSLFL